MKINETLSSIETGKFLERAPRSRSNNWSNPAVKLQQNNCIRSFAATLRNYDPKPAFRKSLGEIYSSPLASIVSRSPARFSLFIFPFLTFVPLVSFSRWWIEANWRTYGCNTTNSFLFIFRLLQNTTKRHLIYLT